MARAVVHCGSSKAAAARQFNTCHDHPSALYLTRVLRPPFPHEFLMQGLEGIKIS